MWHFKCCVYFYVICLLCIVLRMAVMAFSGVNILYSSILKLFHMFAFKRRFLLFLSICAEGSWSCSSLASHRGGPGSRPGLASGILCWTKWRRGRFLWVLRFPLPKPFIPPTSTSSSQSPGAISKGLATSWSPVQEVLPTVLHLETEIKRKVSWRRPRPKIGL
jgi:hypothetical protein